MPVQQQMASFARGMGAEVARANAEHAGKPVDTGNRRLPAGIREGVARLSAMYTKQYEDDKQGLKGKVFFRASAIVVSPKEFAGQKIDGMVTQKIIPLCAEPARGRREERTLSQNWYDFQNVFKLLGIGACPETPETDPDSSRTEAYYFAAMRALTDPERMKNNPVYITFSTRGWTPPATNESPNPQEMVFEEWHGLADPAKWNGKSVDPAAGVSVRTPPPPTGGPAAPPTAPPPSPPTQTPAEVVAGLVSVAMDDPEGATEEGLEATGRLEDMAVANGWTREQTTAARDWAEVGQMALSGPIPPVTIPNAPSVGTRWDFCKRGKDGSKLTNKAGQEFPPVEVEVVTVNEVARTCTVKTVKDGKSVMDLKTKTPVEVKFEWLEKLPF